MRIDSKQTLFGLPILSVRGLILQAMQEKLWGNNEQELWAKVALFIKLPEANAVLLVEQLVQEDYLVLNVMEHACNCQYELRETDKGRRFGMATAGAPLSRLKATQILSELINRAKEINANDELVYYVERLTVFGSYLSDKPVLNDLDVAVKLGRRYTGEHFTPHNQKRIETALLQGKRFSNFVEQLLWPRREVMLMLKAKQRGLSIHDEDDDGVLSVTTTKVVFEQLR